MTDPIVDAVCAKLQARSAVGLKKYGTTLADNVATVKEKLTHIQEELMDGANYVEWLLEGEDIPTPMMIEMEEKWEWISGYKGIYKVSNYGDVKRVSCSTKKGNGVIYNKKEMIIKPRVIRKYFKVGLNKDGKHKTYFVHRLVIEAFNGKSKLDVNHIDGNRFNNNLSNLEYVSRRENVNHFMRSKNNGVLTGAVYVDGLKKPWSSRCELDGKTKYIGYFKTKEEAHKAYIDFVTKIGEQKYADRL